MVTLYTIFFSLSRGFMKKYAKKLEAFEKLYSYLEHTFVPQSRSDFHALGDVAFIFGQTKDPSG